MNRVLSTTDTPRDQPERVRLDVWLDVACLFKTRSEAQRACKAGKVEIGGAKAKPHRELVSGERIAITRGHGRTQVVVVKSLASQHVAKAEARLLYEDVTPILSAEERAWQDLLRLSGPARPRRAPTSRERRELRRLKER